jgi:hypothetical protein
MPLYHCNRLDLAAGALVSPGNYGRIIQSTGPRHQHRDRETVLESVRQTYFPHKPSRLNSTFSCESIDTIRYYKQRLSPQDIIYEVEICAAAAPWHKGDFNAVEPLPRRQESMAEIAFKYWQYSLKTNVAEWPGVECSEILSASALRIIAKLDEQRP